MSDDLRWHAVYTYPRHEQVVAEQFDALLLETYLPTLTAVHQWKDRRAQIKTPVFPGYVFTRIGPQQRNKVLNAKGVARILSFNGKPAPIDDMEMDSLKLCLERGTSPMRHPVLAVGDRVRVRSGVLQGLEGTISGSRKQSRLVVPLSLIHQSISIEIDVDLLDLIDDQIPFRIPQSAETHARYSAMR